MINTTFFTFLSFFCFSFLYFYLFCLFYHKKDICKVLLDAKDSFFELRTQKKDSFFSKTSLTILFFLRKVSFFICFSHKKLISLKLYLSAIAFFLALLFLGYFYLIAVPSLYAVVSIFLFGLFSDMRFCPVKECF